MTTPKHDLLRSPLESIEIIECHGCGALHFQRSSPCPDCGRSRLYQCWGRGRDGKPLQTHANAAAALMAESVRLLKRSEAMAARAVSHTALARAKGEVL